MTEWILIITIHLLGTPGNMNNFEVETIDGFHSEKSCLKAAEDIGSKIVAQSSNHRSIQKILNEKHDKPAVFTDCQKIIK